MDQLKKFNQWLKEHSSKQDVASERKPQDEDPFLLEEEEQEEEIGNLLQQYGILLEYERMQCAAIFHSAPRKLKSLQR
eukprot:s699_g38.t1